MNHHALDLVSVAFLQAAKKTHYEMTIRFGAQRQFVRALGYGEPS
jgi:hypothetical protein